MEASVLPVVCFCVLVASIFYIFYINRVAAWIITVILRVRYWNQGGSSIWVHIGSINFSVLAGRILLRDVRYHSSNQTIKIVKVQLSWRWWLRVPATEDDLNRAHLAGDGDDFHHSLPFPPCRVKVTLQGFQWFLYNRTPAYDNIVSQMQEKCPTMQHSASASQSEPRRIFSRNSGFEGTALYPASALANLKAPQMIHSGLDWIKRQLPYLDPMDLLPISIEGVKGSIVCGNASTPSLMVAEFGHAYGRFGIVQARSRCDLYKQLLKLKFDDVLVQFVENEQYRGSPIAIGRSIHERVESSRYAEISSVSYLPFKTFARIWKRLSVYGQVLNPRHPPVGSTSRTLNLPRFLPGRRTNKSVDEDHIGVDFNTLEYAIERKIIECPVLDLSYYADIVGDVPHERTRVKGKGLESFDVGNGDLPPEWGVDLVIRNGTLRYGPWADRQRVQLQRVLFPSTFHDLEPSPYLRPGDKRTWTAMKVFVELREETSLHIPFREPSKNWMWDGAASYSRPRTREQASIHILAGDNSSISYLLPMVVGPDGYEPRLEVHLDTISITSSLNDIKLVGAESCRIHAGMPSPLKWNAERDWSFSISFRQPTIYLLRDHINMFTDLSRDWVSGPPGDPNHFVPTNYLLNVDLHHFNLNLYANDQNIIDKPLIKESNVLVTARASLLHTAVSIPSNAYRPEASTIPFCVDIPDVTFSIALPRWNTQYLYSPDKEHHVLRAGTFNIEASYHYFAEVHPENVEQLKLQFKTADVSFRMLGWAVRYIMVLRDNYFGSFTHFSTLYEYLDKRERLKLVGDPVEMKYRPGKSNIMQVELSLTLDNGSILMPAGIPGYEDADDHGNCGAALALNLPELQVDLRLHDYFMEMSLNVDTITGSVLDACDDEEFLKHGLSESKDMVIIDGIDITGNRLFGPQPRTRTYICIWELQIGKVKSALSAYDGRVMEAAFSTFGMNYSDIVNAPAAEFAISVDPDVTFVKLSVEGLVILWHAGPAAVEISLPQGLELQTNDLESYMCSKILSLRVPLAMIKVLLSSPSSRRSWSEAASVTFDLNLDNYAAPKVLPDVQADYVRAQDEPTLRAYHLFQQIDSHFNGGQPLKQFLHANGVYLPQLKVNPFVSTMSEVEATAAPNPRWSQHPTQQSDSEGEEHISEAVRDARLARSRLAIPITPDDRDNSMSDGDESDDADLTDSDFSDSDWSMADAAKDSKALFAQYQQFVRQYREIALTSPLLWEESPFLLTKNVSGMTPGDETKHRCNDFCPSSRTVPKGFMTGFPQGLRAEVIKGVRIQVTPLIILAAEHLEIELSAKRLSTQLYLDDLMSRHIKALTGDSTIGPPSCTDIRISSVCSRIVKHASATQSQDSAADSSFFALITLRLSQIHARIDKTASDRKPLLVAHAAAQEACLTFNVSDSVHQRRSSGNTSGAKIVLEDIAAQYEPRSLSLGANSISLSLGANELERMMDACQELLQEADKLSQVVKRSQRDASLFAQRMMYFILLREKHKPAVDPLSTIQPSLLVQRDQPQKIRTDAAFKFLFHARSALPGKADPSILPPRDPPEDALKELTEELMATCLNSLSDVDTTSDALPILLAMVHPSSHKDAVSKLSGQDPQAGTINIGSLDLALFNDTGQKSSYLHIDGMKIRASTGRTAQALSLNPSFSQSSVRSYDGPRTEYIAGAFFVEAIDAQINPYLMKFAQSVLRVGRRLRMETPLLKPTMTPKPRAATPRRIIVVLTSRRADFRAVAENLVFQLTGTDLNSTSSILLKLPSDDKSTLPYMDHSFQCGSFAFHFGSTPKTQAPTNRDILASLEFIGSKLSATIRPESSSPNVKVIVSTSEIILSVPRSALRLYRFIESWRQDFLPGIEATMAAFISELKTTTPNRPGTSKSPRSPSLPPFHIDLNAELKSLRVSLQVMRGTWLTYEIHRSLLFLTSLPDSKKQANNFGLQVGGQVFIVSNVAVSDNDNVRHPRVKFSLPKLSISGQHRKECTDVLALLDHMDVLVKTSHWDTLLVVQQKFGQDFSDLLNLVNETRQKRTTSSAPENPIAAAGLHTYNAIFKLKGFRAGLQGISSTFYLDCEDVGGFVTNKAGLSWQLRMQDLALSLALQARDLAPHLGFNRQHRSVFVVVDVKAGASSDTLQVAVPKIEAVMQPSSIGELGDFIDHLQADMLIREDQRAAELAAFKEKAQTVLKTFEVKVNDVNPEPQPSWLSKHTIDVMVENIGVAFPLTLDQDLDLPKSGGVSSPSIRAFLFAVRRIKFSSQKGEVGQMSTKDLSFQFVPSFRQTASEDFIASRHQTRNRLLYPMMSAQLRATRNYASQSISVSADVSGFVLELDSKIPDYVFSLIDVYRQGKERMDQLAVGKPKIQEPPDNNELPQHFISPGDDRGPVQGALSNVCANLIFRSGEVHVHCDTRSFDSVFPMRPETEFFDLPNVSVWLEYRASSRLDSEKMAPSMLLFNSTIHSSQNTLRPTLLPFVTDIVDYVQTRLRHTSRQPTVVSPSMPEVNVDLATSAASRTINNFQENSSLQIIFSLRIDKSTLELTCRPDVNVVAGLRWQSGGFIVNILPGAHRMTFSGSVDGLTAGLKHGFLSEDCVRLDARNLAFSLTFAKQEYQDGSINSAISLTLATDISGVVRFSRLQDVLCFKAVWLDRIPVFAAQRSAASLPAAVSTVPSEAVGQELTTVILIRLRRINVEVDLGQSITNVTLNLENATARTRFSEASSEVSFFVSQVEILAKGNIAGVVTVPNCVFQTVRRNEDIFLEDGSIGKMLELNMTSGSLVAMIESDQQPLLHYRAEPVHISIGDDWSFVAVATTKEFDSSTNPLMLSFSVFGTEIVAMATIATIPKILSYVKKFKANIDAQREGASLESAAFRFTQSPKPDNPLSEVASAMLSSARSRFKEAESDLRYLICQQMSFELSLLRLVVFPRTMVDMEFAQFTGRDVHASLERVVQDGSPSKRVINLAFTTLGISKLSRNHHLHVPPSISAPKDKEWIESLLRHTAEATIVGLPSMTIRMSSEEELKDFSITLIYDFVSEFSRQEEGKKHEDIFITLNVSLYSWLTGLRKTLSREMDQLQGTTQDWRSVPGSASPPSASEIMSTRNGGGQSPTLPSARSPVLDPRKVTPLTSSRGLASSMDTDASPALEQDVVVEDDLIPASDVPASVEKQSNGIVYKARTRHIERLTMRQLGEATPDVMHPFFMKKAGFSLEDSFPQYVHEYATVPLEGIMEALLKLYSKQLRTDKKHIN